MSFFLQTQRLVAIFANVSRAAKEEEIVHISSEGIEASATTSSNRSCYEFYFSVFIFVSECIQQGKWTLFHSFNLRILSISFFSRFFYFFARARVSSHEMSSPRTSKHRLSTRKLIVEPSGDADIKHKSSLPFDRSLSLSLVSSVDFPRLLSPIIIAVTIGVREQAQAASKQRNRDVVEGVQLTFFLLSADVWFSEC